MISTPTLPAKVGYVEIVDSVGNHVYKPTQETIDKQKMNDNISINSSDITTNKADVDDQLLNLQLALCETYEGSDKQLTELQSALCDVYEMIIGLTGGTM